MTPKTAFTLHRLARQDSSAVEAILDYFGELREAARDALEAKENPEMRGRAKALADLMQMFDTAAQVAQRVDKESREAP